MSNTKSDISKENKDQLVLKYISNTFKAIYDGTLNEDVISELYNCLKGSFPHTNPVLIAEKIRKEKVYLSSSEPDRLNCLRREIMLDITSSRNYLLKVTEAFKLILNYYPDSKKSLFCIDLTSEASSKGLDSASIICGSLFKLGISTALRKIAPGDGMRMDDIVTCAALLAMPEGFYKDIDLNYYDLTKIQEVIGNRLLNENRHNNKIKRLFVENDMGL